MKEAVNSLTSERQELRRQIKNSSERCDSTQTQLSESEKASTLKIADLQSKLRMYKTICYLSAAGSAVLVYFLIKK